MIFHSLGGFMRTIDLDTLASRASKLMHEQQLLAPIAAAKVLANLGDGEQAESNASVPNICSRMSTHRIEKMRARLLRESVPFEIEKPRTPRWHQDILFYVPPSGPQFV